MCGRVVCHSSLDSLGLAFNAMVQPTLQGIYQPSYNIPPSHPLPIVCGEQSKRALLLARWGLLPHWAKDESLSFKTFNARSETIQEKPSFRGAFKYRRCLIPVDGYYEWQRTDKTKLPYYFYRTDGQVMVLAGLFELWREELLTCTIITTAANSMADEVHHRMPVVLEPDTWQTWLEAGPDQAEALLQPAAHEVLSKHRVDSRVNSAQYDDAILLAPV